MLIANGQVQKVFELHLHKIYNPQVRFADPIGRSDKLTLSGRANEIQAVRSCIATLPDIRSDKVRSLQQSVSNGTYQANDYDIATAILTGSMSRISTAN